MAGRLTTADAIDPSGLSDELKDYYIGNKEEIHMNMFYDNKWDENFRVIDDVKDKIPLFNMDLDFEVRPQANYKAFAGQDDAFKVGNRWLQTEEMKVDLIIVPQEMARTYAGKYYEKGSNIHDMSFAQFFFSHINSKIVEKMHLEAFYKGVRDNAGTDTVDTMNGQNKLIVDEIAASTITVTATGAITAANVIAKLELLCDAADSNPKYASIQKQMTVNNQIFNWYWKARRETFKDIVNTYEGKISQINELPMEGYNVTLVREHGLGVSQRVCITNKSNKVLGFDSMNDWNNIILQPFERVIKVLIDFKAGFNFATFFDGSVTVNDQT